MLYWQSTQSVDPISMSSERDEAARVLKAFPDLYQVLNVAKDASASEIKRAYFVQARRLHPDKNNGDAECANAFKHVSRAYAVLSNADQREIYDHDGLKGVVESESAGDPPSFLVMVVVFCYGIASMYGTHCFGRVDQYVKAAEADVRNAQRKKRRGAGKKEEGKGEASTKEESDDDDAANGTANDEAGKDAATSPSVCVDSHGRVKSGVARLFLVWGIALIAAFAVGVLTTDEGDEPNRELLGSPQNDDGGDGDTEIISHARTAMAGMSLFRTVNHTVKVAISLLSSTASDPANHSQVDADVAAAAASAWWLVSSMVSAGILVEGDAVLHSSSSSSPSANGNSADDGQPGVLIDGYCARAFPQLWKFGTGTSADSVPAALDGAIALALHDARRELKDTSKRSQIRRGQSRNVLNTGSSGREGKPTIAAAAAFNAVAERAVRFALRSGAAWSNAPTGWSHVDGVAVTVFFTENRWSQLTQGSLRQRHKVAALAPESFMADYWPRRKGAPPSQTLRQGAALVSQDVGLWLATLTEWQLGTEEMWDQCRAAVDRRRRSRVS